MLRHTVQPWQAGLAPQTTAAPVHVKWSSARPCCASTPTQPGAREGLFPRSAGGAIARLARVVAPVRTMLWRRARPYAPEGLPVGDNAGLCRVEPVQVMRILGFSPWAADWNEPPGGWARTLRPHRLHHIKGQSMTESCFAKSRKDNRPQKEGRGRGEDRTMAGGNCAARKVCLGPPDTPTEVPPLPALHQTCCRVMSFQRMVVSVRSPDTIDAVSACRRHDLGTNHRGAARLAGREG